MKKVWVMGTVLALSAMALVPQATVGAAANKATVTNGVHAGAFLPEAIYLEKEPNDTYSQALASKNEVDYDPIGAISTASDVDWYYLDDSTYGYDERVTLQLLEIPAGTDYDLDVYDENLKLVATSRNGGNDDEEVDFVPNANRTYYFKVYSYSGYSATAHYQVNLYNAY